MLHRSRSLTDFLLLRAWIEPDHEHRLRVLIRQRGEEPNAVEQEQLFADEESAVAFVRTWLLGLVRRWENGERSGPSGLTGEEQAQELRDRREG